MEIFFFQIETSLSENNVSVNGKKSNSRTDVLQSK